MGATNGTARILKTIYIWLHLLTFGDRMTSMAGTGGAPPPTPLQTRNVVPRPVNIGVFALSTRHALRVTPVTAMVPTAGLAPALDAF